MENVPVINAIPTTYNGITFRSRTEARWAVFFDKMGIAWQYEAEGYQLPNAGYYLPDFWLPDLGGTGTFFEVKPNFMDGADKAEELSMLTMKPVAISNGNDWRMAETAMLLPFQDEDMYDKHVSWDYYGFIRCHSCHRATLSYCGSCPRQEYDKCKTGFNRPTTEPQEAYEFAMKHRFWNPGGTR